MRARLKLHIPTRQKIQPQRRVYVSKLAIPNNVQAPSNMTTKDDEDGNPDELMTRLKTTIASASA